MRRKMIDVNLPNCPYYLISRTSLVVTSALKKGFAEEGVEHVRPAYLSVLLSLYIEDGLKVVELARRAGLETSTMTGLLDRMERDGLVVRSPDPLDRRAYRINLTEEGRRVKKPVAKTTQKILDKVFAGISPEELDQTAGLLRRVLENANKGED